MTITKEHVDVVVVGLGWAGAILAKEMLEAGMKVVALERGPDRDETREFAYPRVVDELEGSVHRRFLQSLSQETLTIRHAPNETAVPYRQMGSFKPGTGVGGAGSHWSGCQFRALPEDMNLRTQIEERYGRAFIPEHMTIQDFPVTYDELEGSFDKFEKVCGTSGKAGVLNGKVVEGGNPFEGSRSSEFPTPPTADYLGAEYFYRASRELGYHAFPIPSATLSKSYTNPYGCQIGPCNYCGFCSDYGCLNYSKASPNICVLPAVRRHEDFELRTLSQVLKVNLDSSGKKATGVTYLDAQGRECVQPADLIFVCTFAYNNVHMMLVSGIGKPYDPISNQGVVGRNYSYQNLNRVTMFFGPEVQANGFIGIGGSGVTFDDLNGKQLDATQSGFVGGGIIWARQPGSGPVRGVSVPPGTPSWGSSWKKAARESFRHNFYFEVQGACMSYRTNYLDLDPTYKDAFGRPLLRMTFNWDPNEIKASQYLTAKAREMAKVLNPKAVAGGPKKDGESYDITKYQSTHTCGGAIMGDDPSTSALNKYLQCWDVHNVFVVGANAFPQNNGYNPTGMVGALAYWTAKAVREQYLSNPRPLVAI